MKAALLLVIFGAAAISASPAFVQQPPEKIVGGTQADRGEFPWIVSIRRGGHSCGGTIVNANWVLTAAHCVQQSVAGYTIVAGEHNQNVNEGSEQSRTVSKIIAHPKYNANTFANDIALMRVSTPFTFNNYVAKGNIASSSFNPAEYLVVAGWGTTSEGGSISSTLMKVTVPLVPTDVCNKNYNNQILPGMLCAGVGGKDSCQGDSGGPLHSGSTLTGVVSWGYGCARPENPGVYSSVPYFSDWIATNTAN